MEKIITEREIDGVNFYIPTITADALRFTKTEFIEYWLPQIREHWKNFNDGAIKKRLEGIYNDYAKKK